MPGDEFISVLQAKHREDLERKSSLREAGLGPDGSRSARQQRHDWLGYVNKHYAVLKASRVEFI